MVPHTDGTRAPAAADRPLTDTTSAALMAAAAARAPLGIFWDAGTSDHTVSAHPGDPGVESLLGPGHERVLRGLGRAARTAGDGLTVTDLGSEPAGTEGVDLPRPVGALVRLVRAPDGQVLGAVGALCPGPRSWSAQDVAGLEALTSLLARAPRESTPHEPVGPGGGSALGRDLGAASEQLRGLVEAAARSEDPALRRRAGIAEHHLDRVRATATRLRRTAAGGEPAVDEVFDVGRVVSSVADWVGSTLVGQRLSVQVSDSPLPARGSSDAATQAVSTLLTGVLASAQARSVVVRVQPHSVSPSTLQGRHSAELQLAATETVLGAGDLARIVAGFLAPGTGVSERDVPVTMHVAGRETRVQAPGIHARTGTSGTHVAIRWSVDLG